MLIEFIQNEKTLYRRHQNKYCYSDKRCGYILIEMLMYICISVLLITVVLFIFILSNRLSRDVIKSSELKEISFVLEDKIRTEITNSVGVVGFEKEYEINKKYKNNNFIKKYIDDGYIDVRKIIYDIEDREFNGVVYRKSITKKTTKNVYIEYISKSGKYQIGNCLECMLVNIDNTIPNREKLDIVLILNDGESNFIKNFQVYK